MGARQGPEQSHLYGTLPTARDWPRPALRLPLPTTIPWPLADQVELFSICPLEPWETHTSLKSQTRECSRLFQVSSCCQLPPVPCLPAQIGEGYSSKSVSKTFLASCQRMRRHFLQVPPPIFNRGFSQSC